MTFLGEAGVPKGWTKEEWEAYLASPFITINSKRKAAGLPPYEGEPVTYTENKYIAEDAIKLDLNDVPYYEKARSIVYSYVMSHLDVTDGAPMPFDVYVVWFCKTLQHWKALVSTSLLDGMYYEVTHNGTANETYLDAYKKFQNVVIRDEAEK